MLTPSDFMLYAGPIVLLFAQAMHSFYIDRKLKSNEKHSDTALLAQTADLKQTARASVAPIANMTAAAVEKLGVVHELVNGNTTAMRDEIAQLRGELKVAIDTATDLKAQLAAKGKQLAEADDSHAKYNPDHPDNKWPMMVYDSLGDARAIGTSLLHLTGHKRELIELSNRRALESARAQGFYLAADPRQHR